MVAEKGVVTLPFCAVQFLGALIPDEKLKISNTVNHVLVYITDAAC